MNIDQAEIGTEINFGTWNRVSTTLEIQNFISFSGFLLEKISDQNKDVDNLNKNWKQNGILGFSFS